MPADLDLDFHFHFTSAIVKKDMLSALGNYYPYIYIPFTHGIFYIATTKATISNVACTASA